MTEETNRRTHGPQEYRGNGKHKWEPVIDQTWRLRVPGGWLYAVEDANEDYTGMTFVPVPAVVGYAV